MAGWKQRGWTRTEEAAVPVGSGPRAGEVVGPSHAQGWSWFSGALPPAGAGTWIFP